MRTERIALGVALAIGGIVAQGAASAQEYRGTMEQQMACTPDVWRLCSDQIPDVNRIVACLQQNSPQLSSGCRAVFRSNNQVQPQQQVPRGRAAPPPRYNNAPPPPQQMQPPPPYDNDDD
ncbi:MULTISPECIES: hypothetical protein [Bradyrhizobium]|uniref:hypothetical protein n=1 Tax=Bradyrhizobium TaxID=374 RepID=UPI000426E27D|nr:MULTISPECIES: hypothetical protein [Bradyrhizobium]QOG18375.1 hypothetical protein FOM02_14535 [Bradyrhizobium sp. SEMIA]UFW48760.1 hypothetical protein BaraCB756_42095 [Bradyrhizobium arachidis]